MSQYDLLTVDETSVAAGQGWLLAWVYDRGRLSPRVLPTPASSIRRADLIAHLVVQHARNGDAVAIKALRLMVKQDDDLTTRRRPARAAT